MLTDDAVLTKDQAWLGQMKSVGDWSQWLAESDHEERAQVEVLRQHVERGLPCGAEDLIRGLELRTGQALRPTPVGRPRKSEHESAA